MNMLAKNIVFILGILPFISRIPYLLNVWRYSPLERGDIFVWLSVFLMLPLAEWLRRRSQIVSEQVPRRVLLPTLAFLILIPALALAFYKHINAAVILLSILLAGAVFDIRFGRRAFVAQFPTLCMAILGVPSLSYWLNYYLNISMNETGFYTLSKLALGWAFFALWGLYAYVKRRYPRLLSVLFLFALTGVLMGNLIWSKHLPVGEPCFLNLDNYGGGTRWIGREVPLTEADIRFFRGCKDVDRRVYYTENISLGALAVELGDDIHAIHPVSICLQSAGWNLKSSKQSYMDVSGGGIQVIEILAERDGQTFFVCAWFTNKTLSTGDFAQFRLLRKEDQAWWHYQLMTPLDDGMERARDHVRNFIKVFRVSAPPASPEKSP